ncbi:MAG: STAS domain-containing protein [Steroidobacteraceae bacterium]|nr:STAS domain-containing protein [Steroidobacteraceae bacterium]
MIELVEAGPQRLALRGGLDFGNAVVAHQAGLAFLARDARGSWVIDCSGLESANSAALAVLLDWLASAHRAGGHLRFEGLPERVRAIAGISEVDELLEAGV